MTGPVSRADRRVEASARRLTVAKPVGLAAAMLAFTGIGIAGGCEAAAPCEEDPRAQILEETRALVVAGVELAAEWADDPAERERGWRFRRCGREALALVAPEPEPLAVWGCGLAEPVDAAWIARGAITRLERIAPCGPPCGGCPIVSEDRNVDGAVEVPVDTVPWRVGDAVEGF